MCSARVGDHACGCRGFQTYEEAYCAGERSQLPPPAQWGDVYTRSWWRRWRSYAGLIGVGFVSAYVLTDWLWPACVHTFRWLVGLGWWA